MELGFDAKITLNNEYCDFCNVGLYMQLVTTANINQNITIMAVINNYNNKYISKDFVLTITSCPPGYGVSGSANQCEYCVNGYYSMTHNNKGCNKCKNEYNYISCDGGHQIIVDRYYWMGMNNEYSTNKLVLANWN